MVKLDGHTHGLDFAPWLLWSKKSTKKSSTDMESTTRTSATCLLNIEKERRRLIGKQIKIPHFLAMKLNLVDI
jgi:hypothetical protein